MSTYTVKKALAPIRVEAPWDSEQWRHANTLKLEIEVARKNDHRPDTRVRMLYDKESLCGIFQVKDQYVRAVREHDQESVCQDSCVEFFIRPANEQKYFNFEMNCGGTMLLYHITHCRSGNFVQIPQEDLDSVTRIHSLPRIVEPEIIEPVTWTLAFRIPLSFFVKYAHISTELSGQIWHANFTKCGGETSHPHWLSWMPLSKLDFHLPDEFGEFRFE